MRELFGGTIGAILTGAIMLIAGAFGGDRASSPLVAAAPSNSYDSVSLCTFDTTVVNKHLNPAGDSYSIHYEGADPKSNQFVIYDLNWNDQASAIAMERLNGSKTELWAEVLSPGFAQCVALKMATEGKHVEKQETQ